MGSLGVPFGDENLNSSLDGALAASPTAGGALVGAE